MTEPIRLADVLQVADQIELRVIDLDTGETRRYKSTVEDVTPEGILVTMPVDRRAPVPIPEGSVIVVSMWKGFADHLFKSRILKKVGGHVPQLLLSKPRPEGITRTPRREFFRVDTKIPTKVRAAEGDEKISLAAIMLDLSASGCRLQTARRVAVDSAVTLDFDLPFPPDEEGIDRAKPMRQVPGTLKSASSPAASQRPSGSKRPTWFLGIEFDKLDNVVYNSLLRYVAFRQRELLNQLKEAESDGSRPRSDNLNQLEERLTELEEELEEAGQAVPPPAAATPPPTADRTSANAPSGAAPDVPSGVPPPTAAEPSDAAPDTPDPDSADALFAPPPPAAAAATPDRPEVRPPSGPASGKTILLVEDEDVLRGVFAEALQHEGHRIIEAANGQDALEIALGSRVDLVLTDLMMPRMNGWRLLSSLRERKLDVPVVIITGYMSEEGQEVLNSKDIAGYLVKPINLEELIRMVERVFAPPETDAKPRVLAVDDEEETRLLVGTCLEQAGFDVETAADGQEALEKVGGFRPDLVVLDITMPRMDGFETCRRLRAWPQTAQMPVIMLTGKSSAEYVRKAVQLKINGYMVKPFDPDTLVARVRKALQGVGKG